MKPNAIKVSGEDYVGETKSLSGDTIIKFKLWVDENYELYIHLIKSTEGGSVNTSALFPVSAHARLREDWEDVKRLYGYDINKKTFKDFDAHNNLRFLVAVLKHILPKQITGRAPSPKSAQ